MNRLTRDQILTRALDLIDSPALDQQDRPAGSIVATAFSIGWLQDGLDYFHHRFPFGSVVKTAAVTISAETLTAPADFVKDYKNGILLDDDEGRLERRSLSFILSLRKTEKGEPSVYAMTGTTFFFRPIPDKSRGATLYYYSLPAVLAAATVPAFPSDLILVKYTWIRGQEWLGKLPPTAAETYANTIIADLQKAGIGPEAEEDDIPLSKSAFPGNLGIDPNAWMGQTTV